MGFANVTVYRILARKNKVIILFPFLFLIPPLSYFNSITIGFLASGLYQVQDFDIHFATFKAITVAHSPISGLPQKKVPTLKAKISNKHHC